MKIFNWMHRKKFNLRDEYGRNVKKDELIAKDTDTEALLENVAIADIIDGWKGGLLTIGTLGFDPLQKFIDHDHDEEYQFSDENGEESEDDDYSVNDDEYCWKNEIKEGELDPLVCPTFTHSLEGSNHEKIAEKAHDTMIMNIHGNPLSASNDIGIDFSSDNLDGTSDGKSKKRERITLADLFSADTNEHTKPNQAKDQLQWSENDKKLKPSNQAKHGLSFAKKLIPRVSDDSRPIHKLHQLMTRMLKRKVHPDIEGKNHKTSQTKPSMLGLLSNKHGDSVSLLQTEDVEI